MAGFIHSGVWPTALQRLLLQAALLDGTAAAGAFHQWRQQINFDDLDTASFRLLPLLRWNLKRLDIPDSLMPRLDSVSRFLLVETAMKRDALHALVRELAEAGIPRLLLKGSAVGLLYYPDPALRPMADCDVLIPLDRREQALALLHASGWRRAEDRIPPRRYGCDLWRPPFHQILVELHWLSSQEATPREDLACWETAVRVDFRGVPCRAFRIEDEILHTCRHGMSWNPSTPIRWLADCAMIVGRHGQKIDWHFLAERTRKAEATLCVLQSLEWIRKELESPVPESALHALRSQNITPRERRIHEIKLRQKDWSGYAKMFAEFLNRELPVWRWPLRPRFVLNYFAAQFELPDSGDIARYLAYHFWRSARAKKKIRASSIFEALARGLGCRKISSQLLSDNGSGMVEEPAGLCWAKRTIRLEGFYLSGNGPNPMRILPPTGAPVAVKGGIERVDLAQQWPDRPHSLRSGFTVMVDLPTRECTLLMEQRLKDKWQPVFKIKIS